ncbi:MAG: hypothetical protein JO270_06880 [Acidobacteriaceae bacterium]|nr:hypothetical protein [Acidobacteriaceae bacterium]
MPPLPAAGVFVKRYSLRIALVSFLVIIPCLWHTHIEAGDLGSHLYNAWLVDLVQKGTLHDLYVTPQWNNVLCDWFLYQLGRIAGWTAAEKIVSAICVLLFFWGSFAFITAASQKPPWLLTPGIAMIAYGYTFQMGFLNYYLAIGLAFFAMALVWNGGSIEWLAAAGLAILACLAHPIGLLIMIGFIAYIKLAQHTRGWLRLLPPILAVAVIVGLHLYVIRFRTAFGLPFYFMNGTDQVVLYGFRYGMLAMCFLVFLLVAIVYSLVRSRKQPLVPGVRISFELWAVLLFAAAMFPEVIFLPQFAAPVALFVSRGTMISAILLLCILGCLRPQRWLLAGLSVLAAVLFTWLYVDTGRLNTIEMQAEQMLHALPYGSRVVVTMGPPPGSRIWFIEHMVDRACIGHCFMYSNYEPSSGQFWIHARPGGRTATSSAQDAMDIQVGTYRVKAEDLPLKQLYQCRVEDIGQLCMRDLHAGEVNCAACNQPLYWLMRAGMKAR